MAVAGSRLSFEALYYRERLQVVNDRGDIGLASLWSTPESILARIDGGLLGPQESRLSAVAHLFGDGLYAMLCNLLFNPQITTLVTCGQDLGLSTRRDIAAFLSDGAEEVDLATGRILRIRGTATLLPFDPAFDQSRLQERITYVDLGLPTSDALRALEELLSRPAPVHRVSERIKVDIRPPEQPVGLPSEVDGHSVSRRTPLATWTELVVRTWRFGLDVEVPGGPRRELRSVRATIQVPEKDDPEELRSLGFEPEDFARYQRRILDPQLPEDVSYTYGNRLRGHFAQPAGGTDSIFTAINSLVTDRRSRRAHVALWDQGRDPTLSSPPCLTSLFFRVTAGRLSVTASFRAHNLLSAWLENAYGVMAIQQVVSDALGVESGPIIIFSASLTMDPSSPRLEVARMLNKKWIRDDDLDHRTGRYDLREDPNGHFSVRVDLDANEIVAEQWSNGLLLQQFTGRRPEVVARAIAGAMAVSLPSHALWLGQELERRGAELRAHARQVSGSG